MGDEHDHNHADHEHGHRHSSAGDSARGALTGAIALNGGLFLAELFGGLYTGSLALLSDAGHMFVDVAALSLSAFALWISHRQATASKTFGYYRAEVLAALINCLALWLTMALLFWKAVQRLSAPLPIITGWMLAIAGAGLVANLVGVFLLHDHHQHSMNLRSSYLHLLSDALGSVAVLIAGVVVHFSGWLQADALASMAVALLTLWSSWGLLRESVDILMEATPRGVDLAAVRSALSGIGGVAEVHDLHVWTLGSRKLALSAHAVLKAGAAGLDVLASAREVLREDFAIGHVTIQLEDAASADADPCFDCADSR